MAVGETPVDFVDLYPISTEFWMFGFDVVLELANLLILLATTVYRALELLVWVEFVDEMLFDLEDLGEHSQLIFLGHCF